MPNSLVLNNQTNIPALGLGTWRAEKTKIAAAVEQAINVVGYRHLDCAAIYGNEPEIGQTLAKILTAKKIQRSELFITSKLWNTQHRSENVEPACRQTLKDLQLDYLDLYLVHWGVAFAHGTETEPLDDKGIVKTEPVPIQETWRAMEKLVEQGLVKNIGVANFTTAMLIDLLSYAKIKPVMNQIELHPYNSQAELIDYCHQHQIQVTAYSPLGSSNESPQKPLADPVIHKIGFRHGKTPAQVLIKWGLQRGYTVIPKSVNLARLQENFDVTDFELSDQEMLEINKLNRNHRFVDPVAWWGLPYFK